MENLQVGFRADHSRLRLRRKALKVSTVMQRRTGMRRNPRSGQRRKLMVERRRRRRESPRQLNADLHLAPVSSYHHLSHPCTHLYGLICTYTHGVVNGAPHRNFWKMRRLNEQPSCTHQLEFPFSTPTPSSQAKRSHPI